MGHLVEHLGVKVRIHRDLVIGLFVNVFYFALAFRAFLKHQSLDAELLTLKAIALAIRELRLQLLLRFAVRHSKRGDGRFLEHHLRAGNGLHTRVLVLSLLTLGGSCYGRLVHSLQVFFIGSMRVYPLLGVRDARTERHDLLV